MYSNKVTVSEDDQMRLFYEYRITKDKNVRNTLIEANIDLANFVINRYFKSSQFEYEDLMQEAIMSLVTAVECYNPYYGFKFSTYATTIIRNNLYNFHTRTKPQPDISIDDPMIYYSDDQPKHFKILDFLVDESESHISKDCEMMEVWNKVHKWVLTHCNAREIAIFEGSSGMYGEALTGEELAKMFDISKQRVFLIRKKLREKIAGVFRSDFKDIKQYE